MLGVLFLAAGAVLVTSWFRPPTMLWQKAVTGAAALLLAAVLVASGVEAVMQTPVE